MVLQVQIKEQNATQIIEAIKLLKGVKSVSPQSTKAKKAMYDDTIMTQEDIKAYKKAKKELENGQSISLEELKKKYL